MNDTIKLQPADTIVTHAEDGTVRINGRFNAIYLLLVGEAYC